jgi:uncharacterized protein YbjT (DUF2867 family)
MEPSKKRIAVIGATGQQGGGLVEAMLDDPAGTFTPRGVTRDPEGERARELTARGAEMVQADLDDVDSLEAAFDGCHGAFCVTNFWEHFSPEKEMAQAQNLVEAARRTGVSHVVWSTLEDTRERVPLDDDRMPTLMERYKVPHLDSKGASDRFFTEAGVPTTFLVTSFYWDNLIHFGMHPQRGEDGVLAFMVPMGDRPLAGIAAEDIGRCALGIFRAGPEMAGRRVGIAGEHLTGAEMAEALSETFGEPVRHVSIPFEAYRGLGFPGADDLGNMFQFFHDFAEEVLEARPVEASRDLNPELLTFREWLAKHGGRIPRG